MKKIISFLIDDNPVLMLFLGLCSSLAVTTTFEKSFLMGISVTVVLIFSNVFISLIGKYVPEHIKIPVFILIIATFVTVLEMLLHAFVPVLYESLGVYLPLIVVNCIILGRALSVASKSSIMVSIKDALRIGLKYLLVLVILGTLREILGSGTLTIIDSISSLTHFKIKFVLPSISGVFPVNIFTTSAGAFISLGILLGVFNMLMGVRK